MSNPDYDEHLLEAVAQVTGDDKILNAYRRKPGSKLEIKMTPDDGFQFSIISPGEVFWTSAISFLISGVGLFALIGWGLSLAYQWIFGADPSVQTPFMLRAVSLGICVCVHVCLDDNLWNELTRGYRILFTTLVTLVFACVVSWEYLIEDYLGLGWAALLLLLALKSIAKHRSANARQTD